MSVIAFLQTLLDAGLPLDMAMKAAAAHEAATVKAKASGAERQRRYRERKANSVTPCDVTDVTVTSRDAKVSPTPLSKPSEPKGSSGKLPARVRAARRCPEDWAPTDADRAVGAAEGFSPGQIERELAKFRDHTFPATRSDWSATFRNWLRNARPEKPHDRRSPQTSNRDDRLGRMLAGAMAAADG